MIPARILQKEHLAAWSYLKEHESELKNRERGKWNHDQWYAFGRSQNLVQMDDPKLIIQVTAKRPTVLFDDNSLFMTGGGSGPFYGVRPLHPGIDILYFLGILNSMVFGYFVQKQSTPLRGGYWKFSKQYIENFPIRPIDFTDPADAARHEQMVALVQRMLDLHKQLSAATLPHSKDLLQRQIHATDRQIDRLVYELYGLSDEEIGIVEERA